MKKLTKRILAMFLAAAMALSLAACGGDGATDEGTQSGEIPEGKLRELYDQVVDEEDNPILVFATLD